MRLTTLSAALLLLSASTGGTALAASTEDTWSGTPTPTQEAWALIDQEKYAEAVVKLEAIVAENPDNADAWNYMGYAERKQGRFEPALVAYSKALAIDPKHDAANEYVGELYLRMDQPEKAREHLAILDSNCFFLCEEYNQLKAAIDAYEASKGS